MTRFLESTKGTCLVIVLIALAFAYLFRPIYFEDGSWRWVSIHGCIPGQLCSGPLVEWK